MILLNIILHLFTEEDKSLVNLFMDEVGKDGLFSHSLSQC